MFVQTAAHVAAGAARREATLVQDLAQAFRENPEAVPVTDAASPGGTATTEPAWPNDQQQFLNVPEEDADDANFDFDSE